MTMLRFGDKVALVTGAGRGIGKAISLALAKEGASVVLAARTKQEIEETQREVESLGRESLAIPTDVAQSKSVDSLFEKTLSRFARIDILVFCAAIQTLKPVVEITEDMWDSILDVNLKGAFLCCRTAAKQMMTQKHGKIVIIGSCAGRLAMPFHAAYAASKGGLLQFMRVLAMELIRYNINVNTVSPGLTRTALSEEAISQRPDVMTRYPKRIPSGRPAEPEDIANAVMFLASQQADDIVGHELIVDGGTSVLHSGYVWPNEPEP